MYSFRLAYWYIVFRTGQYDGCFILLTRLCGEWGIPLNKKNNKKQRIGDEFKQLQTKIFIKTAIIMFVAIAKEIVELHGGTITARSENEEIEFEVTLPIL